MLVRCLVINHFDPIQVSTYPSLFPTHNRVNITKMSHSYRHTYLIHPTIDFLQKNSLLVRELKCHAQNTINFIERIRH
jgi:hypothetical protein